MFSLGSFKSTRSHSESQRQKASQEKGRRRNQEREKIRETKLCLLVRTVDRGDEAGQDGRHSLRGHRHHL